MMFQLTGSYDIQLWGGNVITLELVAGEMPCLRPPFIARFYSDGESLGAVQIEEILLPGRDLMAAFRSRTQVCLLAKGALPFTSHEAESRSIRVSLVPMDGNAMPRR